jgi:DNA-binding response OmpR family regulator
LETALSNATHASASTRCLIVEDQALIGLALGASLEDAGLQFDGPFTTRAAALDWLAANTPGIAIIDYRLNDGCCLEVARALCSRGVPFIVYSGLPRLADLDPAFGDAPWLEKPTDRIALLKAVARLVPTSGVVANWPLMAAPRSTPSQKTSG